MAKTRLVVVSHDYLDGIMAATVTPADEFTGPTARRVPVALINAYNATWEEMRRVEKQLWQAWSVLPDVKNPRHKDEPEAVHADGGSDG